MLLKLKADTASSIREMLSPRSGHDLTLSAAHVGKFRRFYDVALSKLYFSQVHHHVHRITQDCMLYMHPINTPTIRQRGGGTTLFYFSIHYEKRKV